MNMEKYRINIILLSIFVTLIFLTGFMNASPLVNPDFKDEVYDVALLKSDNSLGFFGKYGDLEHEGAENALKDLGLKSKIISEWDLEYSPLPYKVIVIPNARCLSLKAADRLRDYVSNGGKLFLCYQTGYRDDRNKLTGITNNFHISDMTGADFYRWTNKPPKCEYLFMEDDIPGFKDRYVQLARNTAMLVKPGEDTRVLAYFLDADKKDYSDIKKYSAAIIINKDGNVIYASENLFAPENSSSFQVKKMLASLFNMLVPGLVDINYPGIVESRVSYHLPYKTSVPIAPQGGIIKILVGENYYRVCICAEDKMVMREKDKNGNILISADKGELFYIEPVYIFKKMPYIALYDKDKKLIMRTNENIYIQSQGAEKILNLVKLNENDTYSLKAYRGDLKIVQDENILDCYNYLTLEEYVAGVVPNEMPFTYPEEALKAMTVVARTFALSNKNRHSREGYDVCPTVHCQVYEGVISETDATNEAVSETAGEYITYSGNYAYTTFHSTCGGALENVINVWPGHRPVGYLIASYDQPDSKQNIDLSIHENFKEFIDNPPDSFCRDYPRYRWEEKYSKQDLEKLLSESLPVILNRSYIYLGDLLDIQVVKRSKHGRIQDLKIIATGGVYHLYKDELRWMTSGGRIGTGGLQSTLFYIIKSGDDYIFKGGGWGHGVGLCQSGASGMAKAGYNYIDIIKHYYKGVKIKNALR
ncbi:MAG: SpoIID/LytB domain-containing protein [Armatimonadota bacterium]